MKILVKQTKKMVKLSVFDQKFIILCECGTGFGLEFPSIILVWEKNWTLTFFFGRAQVENKFFFWRIGLVFIFRGFVSFESW